MSAYLYIGSFNPEGDAGYGIYQWDEETGTANFCNQVKPEISAGTVVCNEKTGILYCTNERRKNPRFSKGGGGEVYAMSRDPVTGDLKELNHSLSFGSAPAFAAADAEGDFLIVVNFGGIKACTPITRIEHLPDGGFDIICEYDESNAALFRLNEDGTIGKLCDIYSFKVEGDQFNHRVPHAHSIRRSPQDDFFAVCEMGTDKIYTFTIDKEKEKLILCGGKAHQCPAGSGPRYSAFHPSRPWLFVNFEDKPVVSVFEYDRSGGLKELQTLYILPENDRPGPKDLQSGFTISADGRFLYSAMRGRNLVSVLEIDQSTGRMTHIQTYMLKGDRPKDCALSPDGRFLAVANRASNNVEIMKAGRDGTLSPTNESIEFNAAGLVFFMTA